MCSFCSFFLTSVLVHLRPTEGSVFELCWGHWLISHQEAFWMVSSLRTEQWTCILVAAPCEFVKAHAVRIWHYERSFCQKWYLEDLRARHQAPEVTWFKVHPTSWLTVQIAVRILGYQLWWSLGPVPGSLWHKTVKISEDKKIISFCWKRKKDHKNMSDFTFK